MQQHRTELKHGRKQHGANTARRGVVNINGTIINHKTRNNRNTVKSGNTMLKEINPKWKATDLILR